MNEQELDAIEARAGYQPKGEGDDAIALVAEVRRLRAWLTYIDRECVEEFPNASRALRGDPAP